MLQAKQDAKDIGVEGGGIRFGRLRGDRPGLSLRTRIIDGDIQTPESFHCAIHQVLDIVLVSDIGTNESGFGTAFFEFSD